MIEYAKTWIISYWPKNINVLCNIFSTISIFFPFRNSNSPLEGWQAHRRAYLPDGVGKLFPYHVSVHSRAGGNLFLINNHRLQVQSYIMDTLSYKETVRSNFSHCGNLMNELRF